MINWRRIGGWLKSKKEGIVDLSTTTASHIYIISLNMILGIMKIVDNIIWKSGIRLMAFTLVIFISTLILLITSYLFITFGTPLSSGAVFSAALIQTGTLSIIMMLNAFGVTVWKIGRWLRQNLKSHWEHQKYPHETSIDLSSLSDIIDGVTYHAPTVESKGINDVYKPKNGIKPSRITIQIFLGLILVCFGFIVTTELLHTDYSTQIQEIKFNDKISIISAFVSVILGPVIGMITLSATSLATNLQDLLIIVLIFLLPSTYIGPAMANLLAYLEKHYDNLFMGMYSNESIGRRELSIRFYVSLAFHLMFIIGISTIYYLVLT